MMGQGKLDKDFYTRNTYAENIKAAEYFLKMATDHELGERWNLVAATAFCAFAIEAYLNHVGEISEGLEWSQWDKECHPKPRDKLIRLVGDKLNDNHEPFSEFGEIFELRNTIAHGASITVTKAVRKPQNNIKGALKNLSSEFESRTTFKKVNKLLNSSKSMIIMINKCTLKVSDHELWRIGYGSLKTS